MSKVCIWYRLLFQISIFPAEWLKRSQTSWIWLETKLVELGMIGSDHNYQVSAKRYASSHSTDTLFRYLLVNPTYGFPVKLPNFIIFSSRQDVYVHRLHGT
jgi:hypothetical protein